MMINTSANRYVSGAAITAFHRHIRKQMLLFPIPSRCNGFELMQMQRCFKSMQRKQIDVEATVRLIFYIGEDNTVWGINTTQNMHQIEAKAQTKMGIDIE